MAGVYYAATELEARSARAAPVVVVGGGNSAGQAAMFLAEKGVVGVRRRAPPARARRCRATSSTASRPTPASRCTWAPTVTALHGDPTARACHAHRAGRRPSTSTARRCSRSSAPNRTAAGCDGVAVDEHGFVLTDRALDADALGERVGAMGRRPLPYETSRPGLFAVGDLRSGSTKRVAAAVGEGSAAIRSVHEHLAFAPAPS